MVTALAVVPQLGDPLVRPGNRCYRLAPIYRTVCGQWSNAASLTDWSAVTCPECRRRGLREASRD